MEAAKAQNRAVEPQKKTLILAARLPVRIPDEADFSTYLILPVTLWPWGSTQPLTGMSTRKLLGGKKRPVRRAEKLAAIYEPNI
jgi:hypothetical protein